MLFCYDFHVSSAFLKKKNLRWKINRFEKWVHFVFWWQNTTSRKINEEQIFNVFQFWKLENTWSWHQLPCCLGWPSSSSKMNMRYSRGRLVGSVSSIRQEELERKADSNSSITALVMVESLWPKHFSHSSSTPDSATL